jgi:hypothetical protein
LQDGCRGAAEPVLDADDETFGGVQIVLPPSGTGGRI